MRLFVTSNQQFGRPGALNAYKRPFASVEEMNQHLVQKWNETVNPEDTVFVVGNFAWDPEVAERVSGELNGQIYVIPGEWDRAIKDVADASGTYADGMKVQYMTIGIKELRTLGAVLTYWPMIEWPKKNKGWINFFGYPNKKYPSDHTKRVVNVSCDNWDFKPVEVANIIRLYDDPDLNK